MHIMCLKRRRRGGGGFQINLKFSLSVVFALAGAFEVMAEASSRVILRGTSPFSPRVDGVFSSSYINIILMLEFRIYVSYQKAMRP